MGKFAKFKDMLNRLRAIQHAKLKLSQKEKIAYFQNNFLFVVGYFSLHNFNVFLGIFPGVFSIDVPHGSDTNLFLAVLRGSLVLSLVYTLFIQLKCFIEISFAKIRWCLHRSKTTALCRSLSEKGNQSLQSQL